MVRAERKKQAWALNRVCAYICNLPLSFRYNNRTYRIDDIDWDSNPQKTFNQHDGTPISFSDYFKKVSSEI